MSMEPTFFLLLVCWLQESINVIVLSSNANLCEYFQFCEGHGSPRSEMAYQSFVYCEQIQFLQKVHGTTSRSFVESYITTCDMSTSITFHILHLQSVWQNKLYIWRDFEHATFSKCVTWINTTTWILACVATWINTE